MILMFFSSSAFTQECIHPYEPQELMTEALKKEILFELKEKEIASMDGFITDAYKIYNPDFEHFTTTGNQFGKQNITSESRIWFNLQLANKRDKKADVIRAEKEISQAQLQLLKIKLRKEYFLALLRFKQIQNEMLSVTNLQEVVGDFIGRYTKVSFLSAEQKVEKGSLEMSNNDLTLLEAKLKNESELILRFFQRALREECEIEIVSKDMVKQNNWPKMKETTFKADESLAFKVSQLGIKKSEYELIREDAKKYPDLKVGPVWQLNKLGNLEYSTVGLSFIIPLPFFDRNQGLRSVAQINVNRQKLESDYTRQQISKEFDFRRKNYSELKSKLSKVKELDKYNHLLSEYRALFKRGLITIPNFLSYKREFLNLTSEVHEIESSMADHLVEIYVINNEPIDLIVPKVLNL